MPDLITIPTIDNATRRQFITGAFATALLIACGDNDEESAPEASPTPATRTITTVNGEIEIPTRPQRVASIGYFSAYTLLDIGFTPAGVLDIPPAAISRIYASSVQPLRKIGTNTEVDLEAIAALAPDLILGENLAFETRVYDQLKAIAPTALFGYQASGDWPRLADDFSSAVGRTADLDKIKDRYRQRIQGLQTSYAAALGKYRWSVINGGSATQVTLYMPDSNNGRVLSDLKVQYGSASAGKTGTFVQIAPEQLDQVGDSDLLLYGVGSDGKPSEAQQALLDQPVFKALPAVREGRIFPMTTLFPTSYGAALVFLDEIEGVLKKLA